MDQEIVLDAIKQLFRERSIMMSCETVPDFYVWALNVRVEDEAVFSIDMYEWYIRKMISELGTKKFQEVLVMHICAEIKENLGGGRTYTEKNRTVH